MSGSEVKSMDGKVPFETALNKTGFGLYSYSCVALTGLTMIGYIFIVYGTSVIVPLSACELDTTVGQQGALAASPVIALLLGGPTWGYLGDTRGRRSMLLVSMVSAALLNCLGSMSVNWVMLLVLQFIAALMAAGQYTLCITLLSENIPVAKRNRALLLVTSIYLLSQGASAGLAIPIIPLTFSYHIPSLGIYWNSWRTLVVVYSLPSLISALWLYFMMESSKYVLARGDEQRALEILRRMHKINNLNSREKFQVKGLLPEVVKETKTSVRAQIVPLIRAPLLKYIIIVIVLFIILQQLGSLLMWQPRVMNQVMMMVENGAPLNHTLCQLLDNMETLEPETACAVNVKGMLIVIAIGACHSAINLLLSLVVDKLGRRNVAMALALVCGLSGIMVNLVPNTVASILFYTMYGLGVIVIGVYTAMTMNLFPTHVRALAMSIALTGSRLTQFISIQVTNWLLVYHCEAEFYIFATVFAGSAIVVSFLPDDHRLNTTTSENTEKEC